MIHFEEALSILLDKAPAPAAERIPLSKSLGRILSQDIISDRDLPPYDRVAMDGIAVKTPIFPPFIYEWEIQGVLQAGSKSSVPLSAQHCFEIMTGAALPADCDAVIPYEHLQISGTKAILLPDYEVHPTQNIHKRAADKKKGDVLVTRDQPINPGTLAIAATVGLDPVSVYKQPSIGIISTGSELVNSHHIPNETQIRKSNDIMIAAICQMWTREINFYFCPDEASSTIKTLEEATEKNDIVISIGGVSKGKYDFVAPIVNQMGWEVHFHGVNQKPGKPLLFASKGDKLLLGLPGNPAAAFMTAHLYIVPLLRKINNTVPYNRYEALLGQSLLYKGNRPKFQEAIISQQEGQVRIQPLSSNGSGDFSQFAKTNAILFLPKPGEYGKNSTVLYYPIP
jgi:molybdopterin molybdotransferase